MKKFEQSDRWRFAVDRGGTFTDVLGIDPSGNFHIQKLLSASSEYDDASIEGIRRILDIELPKTLTEDKIQEIRFGTTVATNALLERKGCKVALLITKGFADLLEIGYQDRPDIFQLCIKKPSLLYSHVFEVDERINYRGDIVKGLDASVLQKDIDTLKKIGFDAVAVLLMHAWINPAHERTCADMLHEAGILNVFLSHESINLIKIVSRGQSTLVDAYLSMIISQYLEGIKKAVGSIPTQFMQSSGLLSDPESFRGKNALLSGPAGGVVSVANVADERGIKGVVGFDMGGTSTDVCRVDGELQKTFERNIAGIPLQVETLDIVTVAAGGGSILEFDGQKMTAGPRSAGAYPGPACYGFGGPLTVTDANLVTGRLVPEHFPRTFGPERNRALDKDVVMKKFRHITDQINSILGSDLSLESVATGFLRIANEKMAMAIKEISVSKGFDIRQYTLICYGGAGGQHACSIADLLDIDTIIIHPLSSVMSAFGIGLSRPAWTEMKTVLALYDNDVHNGLKKMFSDMVERIVSERSTETQNFILKMYVDLRPNGADAFLTVPYESYEKTVESFVKLYSQLYGFGPDQSSIEIVNMKVEIQEKSIFISDVSEGRAAKPSELSSQSYQPLCYDDGHENAPVYMRKSIPDGITIRGPAIIVDPHFTVVVDRGFNAVTDETGVITIERLKRQRPQALNVVKRPDPVLLEVFHNIFINISTEMGHTLRNTAHSVNMKERLDFSCAVFDSTGNLVANAPHIPVHLGAMADTVKALLIDKAGIMKSGDVFLTNNPYRGGSHLPDMTVICPVFSETGEIVFFTAARGHHSDIGGTTPGSMPPVANNIVEEGVLIDNFLLVCDGKFQEQRLRTILSEHKHPARNIPERIDDCKAQIAACHKGMSELKQIIARYGLEMVHDYMRYIQDNAAFSVKLALYNFLGKDINFKSGFSDLMDDGTVIKVSVSIHAGSNPPNTIRAVIDFSGSGEQHSNDNLNAPRSVTTSAVLYVLRSLVEAEIPLNSGCLEPVEINIPQGTILNPEYPVPVATGNVETSQRVVDVVLGAFGISAASQGTMNNLLFQVKGEAPYYETIAGGSGAMDGCSGASGVQIHMTNTRITDPEILEHRHPGVQLEQFAMRRGSGGKGRFWGGDGIVREIKFLKQATVSIISERRINAPYGIKGGDEGCRGTNLYKNKNGDIKELRHREVLNVEKNESIIIKTPGGGGYGNYRS